MKKRGGMWEKAALLSLVFALAAGFPAFAGQWKQDRNGWRYENDDGSLLKNGWYWLDGNRDGWAECYYLGKDGYLIRENGHVDGCDVNEDGAWTVDGVVQRKETPVPEGSGAPGVTPYYNLEGVSEENKLFLTALSKNRQMDDMDLRFEISVRIREAEQEQTTKNTVTLKAQGLSGVEPKFLIEFESRETDREQREYRETSTLFYEDGCLYGIVDGWKIKEQEDGESARTYLDGMLQEMTELFGIGEEYLAAEEAGNTVFYFPLDFDYAGDIISALCRSIAYTLDAYDDKISGAEGKIVVNEEGYLLSEECSFTARLYNESVGRYSTVETSCGVYYNAPGRPVTVELPSTEGFGETD